MGKKTKKGGGSYWDSEEYEQDLQAAQGDQDNHTAAPADDTQTQAPPKGKKGGAGKSTDEVQNKNSNPRVANGKPKANEGNTEVTQEDSSAKAHNVSSKGKTSKDAEKSKPQGKKKQLVELIKKQQEEQRQREIEAEEQRKLAEEEAARERERERREAEQERKKAAELAERKKQAQTKKDTAAVAVKKAKDAAFIAHLREQGLLPGETPQKAPQKVPQNSQQRSSRKKGDSAPAEPHVPKSEPDTIITAPEGTQSLDSEQAQVATSAPVAEQTEEDDGDWEAWEDRDISIANVGQPPKVAAEPAISPEHKQASQPKEPAKPEQPKEKNSTKKDKAGKKGAKVEEVEVKQEEKELRSPICCILGHVDTGKTSLLDKIRHTNVQEGEAGGITQQIGATYFPMTTIQEQTASLSEQLKNKLSVKVPGLLIIDTPGHESFTNLRSRGSGLCDIAILVVDIMHGLEPQTIESINLLRMRKTPFIVALNKVDRIYDWKPYQNSPFRESLKLQPKNAAMEFDTRTREAVAAFASQELNAVLYYHNKDFRNYVSLVPTSAVSGEGIPDLLMLLVQLTQRMMTERLYYSPEVQCTVLEVKVTEGYGTTIDVVLVNGKLREGDTIVLSGMQGPIVTSVRALLTPQPLRELRVKGTYIHHKEMKAAMGIKVVAQDLEKAVAGSALLVAEDEDQVEKLKKEVQSDFDSILKSIDSSARGVCVQASTLGSLEALLTFLKASKIPVSGVALGPIHKRDVIRASIMLEHNPEFAVILAFDVKVEKEAQLFADEQGVKIFTADIIYHLFDKFTKYMDELKAKKREEMGALAVWPCILRIKPECIFNKKDPIVLGVEVIEGTLKIGTPICVPSREYVDLGKITSIEHNHKAKTEAKKGDEVAVKIEPTSLDNSKTFGRHFDIENELVSKISRESINALKDLFGSDLSPADKQLIVKLKGVFKIQ